jgi:hypothetical protein
MRGALLPLTGINFAPDEWWETITRRARCVCGVPHSGGQAADSEAIRRLPPEYCIAIRSGVNYESIDRNGVSGIGL